MFQLLVIDAGDTEYDDQGRIQGTLDVPLSAAGRQQVAQAAQELDEAGIVPSALYVGPCRSARETAAGVGEVLHLKPKLVSGLANIDHGLWQGMLIEDVKQNQPRVYKRWRESPDSVCPPQGETLQAVRERLSRALSKVAKRRRSELAAIVAPRPVSRVIRSMVRGESINDLWSTRAGDLPIWELIAAPTPLGT